MIHLILRKNKMDKLVEYIDHMGTDASVVNAARVSFDKLAENYSPEQNDKLIKFLAKHKHWSPFSHTSISMRFKAPVFIARQLAKHQVGLLGMKSVVDMLTLLQTVGFQIHLECVLKTKSKDHLMKFLMIHQ